MKNLVYMLPLLIALGGGILLFCNVKRFLQVSQKGYWFFRILFLFFLLVLLVLPVYGVIIADAIRDKTIIEIVGFILLLSGPMLGVSLGIAILGKYMYESIDTFMFQAENTKLQLFTKGILFLVLTFLFLAFIKTVVIYSIIMCFRIIGTVEFLELGVILTAFMMGLSGFGVALGTSFLASGSLLHAKKLFIQKVNSSLGKKIFSVCMLVLAFLIIYVLIEAASTFNMVVTFSLFATIEKGLLQKVSYIPFMLLGGVGGVVAFLQGYLFFDYHKKNKNIFVYIGKVIGLEILLVGVLVYVFQVLAQ